MVDINSETPSTESARQAALELIRSESTLVLSTHGPEGPWVAPVYYVFHQGGFYFFSASESRHIRQSMVDSRAAAAIFHRSDGWQGIRGIQMSGAVAPVDSKVLSLKVFSRYLQRFEFIRGLFADGALPDMQHFISRFKAHLNAFTPNEIYYTDNRFGFGTRFRIDWST